MISVIIPTMNRATSLRLAIQSFCQQNFLVSQYEILIVDNGSTDSTKDVTEEAITAFPSHQIRYISEPEPGLLSGRHRGALEATGEILTFVDDDIEADTNWLQAIKNSFDNPTVQLVGGRNLPRYEVEPPEWVKWFWWDHPYGKVCGDLSLLDFGDQIREIDANYVWGLNFSIRRSALFELGGFHPDCIPKHLQHFQGDGETSLTQKANLRGYKAIYQPRALVYHQVSKERMTYDYFDKRYFYQGVCDSYTHIRESKGRSKLISFIKTAKAPLQILKKKIKAFVKHSQTISDYQDDRAILYQRFQQAYQQGYQFHQKMVFRHPELLDWVMRSDYWDYKLPNLNIRHD